MIEKEKSRTARIRFAIQFPRRTETRVIESNNPCAPPINRRIVRVNYIFTVQKISFLYESVKLIENVTQCEVCEKKLQETLNEAGRAVISPILLCIP